MSGALALLMPSRLEGLPMVPAEAMAAGVPVVATDVAAVSEVVAPPDGGVLVPPDDAGALAAAALALLDDPARRAARERFRAGVRPPLFVGRRGGGPPALSGADRRGARGAFLHPRRSSMKNPTRTAPAPAAAAAPAPAAPAEPRFPGVGAAAAIYFGLALLYFFPAFLPGRHIYGTDYLAGGYFFHEFISQRFAAGARARVGAGGVRRPAAVRQPGKHLLPLPLSGRRRCSPWTGIWPTLFVIQFGLGGLGAYLLARELGARRWVAFVAGLAFEFTGLTMSWVLAGHEGRIIVATFAPLAFYFVHAGVRTARLAPVRRAGGGDRVLPAQLSDPDRVLPAAGAGALGRRSASGT